MPAALLSSSAAYDRPPSALKGRGADVLRPTPALVAANRNYNYDMFTYRSERCQNGRRRYRAWPFWPNVARKTCSKSLKRLKMGSDVPKRDQTSRKARAAASPATPASDPAGPPAKCRPEKSYPGQILWRRGESRA